MTVRTQASQLGGQPSSVACGEFARSRWRAIGLIKPTCSENDLADLSDLLLGMGVNVQRVRPQFVHCDVLDMADWHGLCSKKGAV